ncbi:MAG TPA: MFS transporter [Candidatus Sulfotelmatobacter sp.]|nr:MFS transporter [Candidatus Sulfotelmatobacter sp.]
MNPRLTIPKLRWVIAALLLGVTLINYIDRTAMPVLVGEIKQSLNLTDSDYSQIVSLFLVAYAIMYAGSGYVIDKIGTKFGMAVFVCLWSISQMLHGVAGGKWSFAACRFGLGLAEPGSFPAAVKAIGEWFPARQRALGVGIFNVGSSLGAAVAAPLAARIALHFGWRAAFIVTGALGIIWLLAWLAIYESPRRNRWLSDAEAAEFREAPAAVVTPEIPAQKTNWLDVVFSRPGLMVILPRFLTDPVIYFVIFWLPAYLEKERGFDLAMVGNNTWMPYVYGGMPGYIIGGLLSGWMIRMGWDIGRSRKTAMTIGAAFLPAAILAPYLPTSQLAIAAMCLVVFGHAVWISNLMALPADLFPPGAVAMAAGVSGMGGAIAGALANWYTGDIVSRFSYHPIFICAGLLHPIAVFLVWQLLPERYFRVSA